MPGALLLPGPAVVPQGLPAGGRRHALCSRPERAAFVVEAARRPARQPRPAPSGCQSGPAALSPELSPRLGPASGARCRIRHGACPAAGARGRKSPSIDRTADAFASLLRDCAAHYDGRERRPEQLLLYHVGRYLYLADALEDLPRDVRAGAYNPLRYRYGADGGTLDPADRAQLLETIDASISMACSAMELLDGRRDRELLSNILYFGLPAVLHAVAEGTFRKAGNRRKT